jgi:hypothetical protein
MILDIVMFVMIWMGVMFNFLQYILSAYPEWNFLPWNLVGMMFFVSGYILIRWRGATTTGWLLLDFPSPSSGEKIGITCQGPSIRLQKIYRSVATYLKTRKDEYYRDLPEGAYGFGGHDARLLDSEVAYVANPTKVRFINAVEQDYYDYEQVKDVAKKEMVNLKYKNSDKYILTNKTSPLQTEQIDLEHNQRHKDLFEMVLGEYFTKINGVAFSLKNYHRFQEKQAAPIQIGSVIHYVKALSAMRAAKVKSGMGNWGKWIIIAAIIAIIGLTLYLIFSGTIKIPGLNVG